MTHQNYIVVEGVLADSHEDAIADVVGDFGTLGAHLTPREGGEVHVAVYLSDESADEVELVRAALEALGAEDLSSEHVAAQDWLASYRADARPFELGKTWWIEPNPNPESETPRGRKRLIVEPRMAFGTGSHESTHLVLLELEDDPPKGQRFFDVGTGSGILALAAQRLGAAWAGGLDIDLQAVFVARQITGDQDFPCRTRLVGGPLAAIGDASFDWIACNMVVSQFMPLAGDIRRILDQMGTVAFSGILRDEETEVRENLERKGLRVRDARYLGDWVCLKAGHA